MTYKFINNKIKKSSSHKNSFAFKNPNQNSNGLWVGNVKTKAPIILKKKLFETNKILQRNKFYLKHQLEFTRIYSVFTKTKIYDFSHR